MTPVARESDLYPPLKAWLEAGGYTVRAEVGGCDIAARKGDELVLVEMKRAINLNLLLQLVKRQEAHASVYAAVPEPKSRDKRWRSLMRLLRRLEAGLLVVQTEGVAPGVDVEFHPTPAQRRRNSHTTRAMLTEMAGRSEDLNLGGSTRRKLVTRYREEALTVAVALSLSYPASPKDLRQRGAPDKTTSILYTNCYGWFERLGTAKYTLTATGKAGLEEYAKFADKIRDSLKPVDPE